MPNGTVFYTGASECEAGNIATYNWSTNTWTAQSPFPNSDAANDAPAALETNGNAIVMTSPYSGTFSAPATFYEWNGTTLSTFPNPANAVNDASYVGHLLVLPTGQIMFTDFSTSVAILTTAGTYQSAWQPTITTAPFSLTQGQTYSISGTQFNGLSAGSSYGDDFQDATNYPLVRIVNNATGHVYYAKTHGHSTMGVATGSTTVSTNFDVPAGMPNGPCELYVVANGIPSAASACTVGITATTTTLVSSVNPSILGQTVTFTASITPVNSPAPTGTVQFTSNGSSISGCSSVTVSSASAQCATNALASGTDSIQAVYSGDSNYSGSTSNTVSQAVNVSPGIYSPANNSTLTGSSVTFQWGAYPGATAYWLDVGKEAGGNEYYQSGSLSSSTYAQTVNSLPVDGSTVYATWYYLVSGSWQSIGYTYTAFGGGSTKGIITSPTPGSALTGSTVTFSWSAGTAATAYWLDIGNAPGGNQYYQSGNLGTALTKTVSGLPSNGSTVYVTLYSLVSGQWLSNAYTYTAYNAAAAGGVMQSPTPGSTLTGSTETFTWTAGAGATSYWLDVGKTAGGNQYFQSGSLGNVQSVTVNSLPTDGSTVYVTLYSLIGGTWSPNAYTYTAYNATGTLAAMQTPTPGSTLSGNEATFTWSSDPSATGYWLDIGSSAGGNQYYQSGNLGTALSTTVNSLPANGSTIYVTLYSLVGGQWMSNAYTYTSGP